MADRLRAARLSLVDALNKATISGLVDMLLDQKVFNDSEKEMIIDSHLVTKDRARDLIDMVVKKGDYASSVFIKALEIQDPELCRNLSSKF